jgi:hypothetical protein
MKLANVVEVRDARAPVPIDPAFTDPSRRARAEQLLRKYPDTNESETAEIVSFLAKGKHLDVGLLAGDREFGPKIDALRRLHPRQFRAGIMETIWFLLLLILPLALVCWLPQLLGRS